MANGSYQEAIQCPRCGLTGKDDGKRSVDGGTRGAQLHIRRCMNPRCKWYDTTWTIQVNPDGTVPDPTLKHVKQFTAPVDAALVAQVRANAEAIQEASTRPGGEIINRGR